jgi:transketolase
MEAATVTAPQQVQDLRYVPLDELRRLRELDVDPTERAHAFADACRINILYMIMRAGSGHIGTSFSSVDIVSWLHLAVLQGDDVYYSSKGHDAPALYSVLIGTERLPFEKLHGLRRLGGLPGHPDIAATPEVNTNTGSLGMGISKAKGFARAARLRGERRRVWVLTGDGELQEGQFWESLTQAANEGFGEITAIVDHNKIQSDTWVAQVSDHGDLEAKLRAFGWEVGRCDGNDIGALSAALDELEAGAANERPKILVADTVKGAGVGFMEPHELDQSGTALYAFHSGAPSEEQYGRALAELETRLNGRLEGVGAAPVRLERDEVPPRAAPRNPQKLVAAYGEALAEEAAQEERLVALDADLYLDTGLIPFRERFPDRFVECGIAEMDMVSQAGALALSGLLPAVHSFACFLAPRANEQIYNNATEHTKVIYAGSLVGLVPGGPGHSHQSVRDIALMGSLPGAALIEPATDDEARAAVRWAVREATGPVYIRLVSVPWELPFEPEPVKQLQPGRGRLVRAGSAGFFVTTGPVMLSQAWLAAERLAPDGAEFGVVALPWLRGVDGGWLNEVTGGAPLFTVDNHYLEGGQGDAVLAAVAPLGQQVVKLGVDRVPVSGTNEEVLRAHRLDAESLAERVGP